MVEMPPVMPPVAACEVQAARDYAVPLDALIARRRGGADQLIRKRLTHPVSSGDLYPVSVRWEQQLESQFGIAPGTFSRDACWGARATAYILRFNSDQSLAQPLKAVMHPFRAMPTLRVQYLERRYAKPLSF
ncbi:hypothetical protein DZC31_29970 (plasmid) [Stenotrophomonas rhizophila]|nr:hypothetical protein DZC31_29970 [Stenotrophomonas rhizophila]